MKGAIYVVSDEYSFLSNKSIQALLEQQNSRIHFYDDPIKFRSLYEMTFRYLEKEQRSALIVVLPDHQFNHIPYDVYVNANRITLSFESLFPNFDGSVIAQCPIEYYQSLFDVHKNCLQKLSVNETADLILREVCMLDAAVLVSDVSVVKAALEYFERFQEALPDILLDRILQYMISRSIVATHTLECFTSKENLHRFLNDQWRSYIQGYVHFTSEQLAESKGYYSSMYFDDPFIRNFIGEIIQPIEVTQEIKYEQWMLPGILKKNLVKKEKLMDLDNFFERDFSAFDRVEWAKFASELGIIQSSLLMKSQLNREFQEKIEKANKTFEQWMLKKYQQLRTLPVLPKPKMVHQIPHYLAKKIEKKVALIVLDGMNFTQWHYIKESLTKKCWSFEEDSVFAWVPSVTSVSRQSIFSGLEPLRFADTIGSTRKEKALWTAFWRREGYSDNNIAFEKSLGLKAYDKDSLAYRYSPAIRIYGAVVDVIDQFMHGATQGSQTVFSELQTWMNSNFLHNMLTDLVEEGFEVYLTSDHGNVECFGIGRIQEGVTVESKGERVRIYNSSNIRNQTASEHDETISWDDTSLPSNYHVLLAENNRAFVPKNDKIVTHGGIHIEEIIVPFVKVNR